MNGLLFIGLILICSISIYFLYRWYSIDGLYVYIVIASLMAFILSFNVVKINNFDTICYFPVYMSIFICIYFMLEKYSKKEIKKSMYLIGFSLLTFIIVLCYSFLFVPSLTNKILIHTKKLFMNNWVILIAYFFILIISIVLSCFLYKYTKKDYDHIFINGSFTTIVVQLIDTFIFTLIGFIMKLSFSNLCKLFVMTYSFKLMSNILYMPLFYLLMKFKKVKKNE